LPVGLVESVCSDLRELEQGIMDQGRYDCRVEVGSSDPFADWRPPNVSLGAASIPSIVDIDVDVSVSDPHPWNVSSVIEGSVLVLGELTKELLLDDCQCQESINPVAFFGWMQKAKEVIF
jgi:hypothetical protein